MNKSKVYMLCTPYMSLLFKNFNDVVKAAAVACSYATDTPIRPHDLIDVIRDSIASKGVWFSYGKCLVKLVEDVRNEETF